MASASASGPPGLEVLRRLSTVNIHQKGGTCSGNKFTVHSQGTVLFDLKEGGHCLTFLTDGDDRGFKIDGVDNTGTKVFHLRRPTVFVSDKVELYMNDKLFSVARKESTFMTPIFSINDAHDTPVLRIKGDKMSENDFKLQTSKKEMIGSIKKQFGGLLKEMFTDKDDYVINFPADLDVRFKLAVIAACVLIDYRYHSD